MIILGLETSCDETSAAVIEGNANKVSVKSNVTATSLELHNKTGGIIPENAAREQIKFILPVINQALSEAFDTPDTLDTFDTLKRVDAIALTYGPGLIGSLLVGVETAKTLAFVLNKPIIPINHMIGHIYANWLDLSLRGGTTKQSQSNNRLPRFARNDEIEFPAIALVVSGGHTDLLLMTGHGKFKLLGGTRDDAAGEAFDKIARLLGLPYPGGPEIEKAAQLGNKNRFRFPRPMIGSKDFDFSFSGLKTAVLREVLRLRQPHPNPLLKGEGTKRDSLSLQGEGGGEGGELLDPQTIFDIAYSTQDAIIDVLIKKTIKAVKGCSAKSILISGGVASNQKLRTELIVKCQLLNVGFFAPQKTLCTDNAAMIASAAYFNYKPVTWKKITADPELYFT